MNGNSFFDNLLLGGKTALIGMLVVFVGLAILIGCIMLMGMLVRGRKTKQSAAEKTEPAVTAAAPVPAEPEEEVSGDDALIAVITAAVAAVWDKKETGFTVRRVRRCR